MSSTLRLRTLFAAQNLTASPVRLLRRGIQSNTTQGFNADKYDATQQFSLDDLEAPDGEDGGTAAMHMVLNERRQDIYFMRLIEHELPKLVCTSMCLLTSRMHSDN
jgi:hypothetical protein